MKLPDWVKPGAQFYQKSAGKDELWHVRGIVDDQAVCRYWRVTKQRWRYECLDPIHFDVFGRGGHIRIKGER